MGVYVRVALLYRLGYCRGNNLMLSFIIFLMLRIRGLELMVLRFEWHIIRINMLLQPRTLDGVYRRRQKVACGKCCARYRNLQYGIFGIRAGEGGCISAKQIDTIKRVVVRWVKPYGVYWFLVFPSVPVTKKPAEVRMGKGKGSIVR